MKNKKKFYLLQILLIFLCSLFIFNEIKESKREIKNYYKEIISNDILLIKEFKLTNKNIFNNSDLKEIINKEFKYKTKFELLVINKSFAKKNNNFYGITKNFQKDNSNQYTKKTYIAKDNYIKISLNKFGKEEFFIKFKSDFKFTIEDIFNKNLLNIFIFIVLFNLIIFKLPFEKISKFSKKYTNILFPIFFFLISLVGIINHEVWRDEWEIWLMARESKDLINFFEISKYQGHPQLWGLLLFILHSLNLDYYYMQILSISFATAYSFLIFSKSPFNMILKILIILNFYFLYEYNIVSRNYGLGVLLIFLSLECIKRKKEFLSNFFIILSFYTHTFFIPIGCSLIALRYLFNHKNLLIKIELFKFLTVLIFAFFALNHATPPIDGFWHRDVIYELNNFNISIFIDKFFSQLHPISISSFILKYVGYEIDIIVRLICLFSLLLQFKTIHSKIFYILIILFYSFCGTFVGFSSRHFGFMWVAFFALLWFEYQYHEFKYYDFKSWLKKPLNLLFLICVMQASFWGTNAFIGDINKTYSNSKNAANYLEENLKGNEKIFTDIDYTGQSILGYLNYTNFYTYYGKYSFAKWKKDLDRKGTKPMKKKIDFTNFDYIILSEEINIENFELVWKKNNSFFPASNAHDESYYIYKRK